MLECSICEDLKSDSKEKALLGIEIRCTDEVNEEIKKICLLGIETINNFWNEKYFEIKSIEFKRINKNIKLTFEIENISSLTNMKLKNILDKYSNHRITTVNENVYIHFKIMERIIKFSDEEIKSCLNFSYDMEGKHNEDIIQKREKYEIFRDDFRGKLGEIAFKKYLEKYVPSAKIESNIDFEVNELGVWDTTDMIVNDKYINVKSVKDNGQFLMVESKRYNKDGKYVYKNNDGSEVKVDYYVLVRVSVKPSIPTNIFSRRLSLYEFLNKAWDGKKKSEVRREIYADVLGIVDHERFLKEKRDAPRWIECNVQTLKKVTNNETVDIHDEEKIESGGTSILQQNNYIMHCSDLDKVDSVLGN